MGIFDPITDALTGKTAQPQQPAKPSVGKVQQVDDFAALRASRAAALARQGLDPDGDPLKPLDSKHQLPGKPGHFRYR